MSASILAAYAVYESHLVDDSYGELALSRDEGRALLGNYRHTYAPHRMVWLRDYLLAGARNGRCPYCDTAAVSTLDHYLPKTRFEEFAVLSLNLIPACERCNRIRGEMLIGSGGGRLWHPYIDHLPAEQVVFADLVLGDNSVAVDFRIANDGTVEPNVFARLEASFELFKLRRFFSVEATSALYDNARAFSRVFAENGSEGVRQHAAVLWDDGRALWGANDWRTALFGCLSAVETYSESSFDAVVRSAP